MSDPPDTDGVPPAEADVTDHIAARVDSFTNLALNYAAIEDDAVKALALQVLEKVRDSIPSAKRRGTVTAVPKRAG